METLKIALVSSQGNVISPPSGYGGLEQGVYDLGQMLIKMGHEVTLVAPEGSRMEGGHVLATIDPTKYDFQTQGVEAELDASNFYIENLKDFDLIHDHSWFGIPYTAKFENESLPVCHTHHGHCDWNKKTIPEYVKNLNFFSISDYIADENAKNGISSMRVYNGTDLEKYEYQEKKVNRLLFVGRLNSIKQPHAAIAAAIDANIPIDIVAGTMFREVGYADAVKAWANRTKGFVRLFLDATHEVKINLMRNARATIVPSAFGEPFGSVCVESMACGTPVIALADGGIPEVVGRGPDSGGIVCTSYKEIVDGVLNSKSISPQRCRKRAEMFSREKNAENYMMFYKEILAGREW